jgi:hypothetical protein
MFASLGDPLLFVIDPLVFLCLLIVSYRIFIAGEPVRGASRP